MNEAMLTIQLTPLVTRLGGPTEPYRKRAASSAVTPSTPMACEAVLADALCRLFAGFVMTENLRRTSPTYGGSTNALDGVSKNICVVINRLNDCSHAFWLLKKRRDPTLVRLRESSSAFRRRYRDGKEPYAAEINLERQFAPDGARVTDTEESASATDTTLALATLQLIVAYRAIDALSESPFPGGAPYSFELACHCLCAAILSLDEYATGTQP